MYINKKILTFFLLTFSFIIGTVYATNNITSLSQPVSEGDIISAEYYNNLNGSKIEGGYCKYSGGKLVCIDDISGSNNGESGNSLIPNWPDILKCGSGGEFTYFYIKGRHSGKVAYGVPGTSNGKWIKYDYTTGNHSSHDGSEPGMSDCFTNISNIPSYNF